LIVTHFTKFTHISELKRQLKAIGAETFEEFVRYSQQFCKRFGLQSKKALDLFNQTVSIKEIGGLNDFVRSHMLEKTDVQTKICELQESYENLIISHTAIQRARKQLEALSPLTDEAEKYTKLREDVAVLQKNQDLMPAFFASNKLISNVKDGQLLVLAAAEFDVFITVDRNLSFQQNIPQFNIAVIVLEAPSNRLADLKPLAPKILAILGEAPKGQATLVSA
jgi:uncharacterized protein YPO0396